jgi:hypothetical protein
MKCDWCEIEFFPEKPWARFHSQKYHDDWHNREKLRRAVARADERRLRRINGHAQIDLASLLPKPVAVRRRRLNDQQQGERGS